MVKLLSAVVAILAALVKAWNVHQIKQGVLNEAALAAAKRTNTALQYQLDVAAGRALPPELRVRDGAGRLNPVIACPQCGALVDLSIWPRTRLPADGG